jgi:hypothetical protein
MLIEIKIDMGDDCFAIFKIPDSADIYKVQEVLRGVLLTATYTNGSIDKILIDNPL